MFLVLCLSFSSVMLSASCLAFFAFYSVFIVAVIRALIRSGPTWISLLWASKLVNPSLIQLFKHFCSHLNQRLCFTGALGYAAWLCRVRSTRNWLQSSWSETKSCCWSSKNWLCWYILSAAHLPDPTLHLGILLDLSEVWNPFIMSL